MERNKTLTKDEEIRQEVIQEIRRETKIINPDGLEVSVDNGVVKLGGHVHSYTDQLAAQAAAERVPGVEAVAQDIEVLLPADSKHSDLEIAESARNALDLNSAVPPGLVKAAVEDGWIMLDGEVEWLHQKEEAESTVSKIRGVKGVTNKITVSSNVKPQDVMLQIEKEFQRMAILHARDIHVEIEGNKAVLSGMVRAWVEKVEAESVVREMPGITQVENNLILSPLLQGKENPPASNQRR